MKVSLKATLCLALCLALSAAAATATAETFEFGSGNANGARCRVKSMGFGNRLQFRNIRTKCWKRMSHVRVQGYDAAGQAVAAARIDTWLGNCPQDPKQYQVTWDVPGNLNVFEFHFSSDKGLVKVHITNTKDCWHP